MNILVKFPTRSRFKLFINTLNLYYQYLSKKHNISFLIIFDEDDLVMNNPEVINCLNYYNNLTWARSQSKTKHEAANWMVPDLKFDVLILASDDMIPNKQGYDDIVSKHMEKNFPSMNGVLHFNDGRWGSKLNTLPIMGAEYYKSQGYIYHTDYIGNYADTEFHEVAARNNKVAYVDEVVIKHQWVEYTGKDDLYQKYKSIYNLDKETYAKRKARGFPKESIYDSNFINNVIRNPELERNKYEFIHKLHPDYGYSQVRLDWIRSDRQVPNFIKNVILKNCKTALDIGCGAGTIMDHFLSKGLKVKGIDIAAEVKNKRSDLDIEIVDALHMPFNNRSFDFVYHFDGLEHIHLDSEFLCLKEAVRVAKKYLCYSIHRSDAKEDAICIESGVGPLHVNKKSHDDWCKFFETTAKILNYNLIISELDNSRSYFVLQKAINNVFL